jgi:hypothetical protein
MSNSSLYDSDFHGWAYQQAALLRNGDLADADIANIVEELESIGRSERRGLTNRLAVLLAHLLKWQVQPELRGNSWRLTIVEQRRQVGYVMEENPSLNPQLGELLKRAYGDALLIARRETGLAAGKFPSELPWTFEQAMSDDVEG